MKIAFLHTRNFFTSELLQTFRTTLAHHEVVEWIDGKDAPALDFEVLLAMGNVGREVLLDQPKLKLIQTASDGYEEVDIDAASELGIWVSYAPADLTGNPTSVAEFAVLPRAYRELSLLLRRPPGREAFPGDIFYIHSRMLERSTHLSKEREGGSLTALPIIETEAQDISAYIPTNLISITDGQVYLSPTLFQLGILPAVDIGKSVSRVGGAAQRAAYRAVAGSLKLAYSQFEELEAFAKFGTRLDDSTQKTIDHGQRIRACLKQSESQPVSMIEQIIVLLALTAGLFDPLPLDKVNDAEQALQKAVTEIPAGVAGRLASSDKFSDDDRKAILDIAKRALASLQPVPAAKPALKPAP
jgi:hypothetical protein